jgi:very-short-patch-repair endonuclease
MLVEPSRTVEVAVAHGRGRTRAPSVNVVQRRRLHRQQVSALPGTEVLWVTAAVQTVVDCCLRLPLIEAVVICDSALRAGDVSMEALRLAARRLCGVREARRVRNVLRLADPICGSVLESVLRVQLLLAGIDGFATQVLISTCRVDFCFADVRLVIEVDGVKWHQDPAPDRVRNNTLACAGYRVLRYRWSEVVHEAPRVLAEIRAAVTGTGCIQSAARVADVAA